jgi:hypothetical protein
MKKTLLTLLILTLHLTMQGQTIFYFVGDTVPCYVPSCGCDKTYQETILPPWDGCIGFDQVAPGPNRSFVLTKGNDVVFDTCITTFGTGTPTQVCWSSLTDTVRAYFCGPDSTSVGVWHFPGVGNDPLGGPIAPLCLPPPIPPCNLPVLPITFPPAPYSFIEGFHTLDTIACYPASCGCKSLFSVNIPPFDGCLEMVGSTNNCSVLITTDCDCIMLDTCLQMGSSGLVAKVCFSSPDTVQFHVCSYDSAYIKITAVPTFGEPSLPAAFVCADTLCQTLGLIHPIEQEDPEPIDIITGQRVSFMQPNKVYLVGRKLQMRIE